MSVEELLYRVAERGVVLRVGPDDRLHYAPKDALGTELLVELRRQKAQVIQVLREDDEMRRTGNIVCERQVFDLAREVFGLGQDYTDDEDAPDVVGY